PAAIGRALGSGGAGVRLHERPVDGEFTCAAGREIWGFPKQVGTFDTDLGAGKRTRLVLDDQLVCEFGVRRGLPLPAPGLGLALTAYSHLDGVTRSEEHTSELQSRENLVCRLLLEKKKRFSVPVC